MDVVEFPPGMSPAKGHAHRAVRGGDQTAEAGIAIDLEQTAEPLQVRHRVVRLAVLTVEVGRGWVARSLPGAIIDRVAP
jgi:hypothetical protein